MAQSFYPPGRGGSKSVLLTTKEAYARMNKPMKPGYPLAEMLLPITGNVTGKNHAFSRNSISYKTQQNV